MQYKTALLYKCSTLYNSANIIHNVPYSHEMFFGYFVVLLYTFYSLLSCNDIPCYPCCTGADYTYMSSDSLFIFVVTRRVPAQNQLSCVDDLNKQQYSVDICMPPVNTYTPNTTIILWYFTVRYSAFPVHSLPNVYHIPL